MTRDDPTAPVNITLRPRVRRAADWRCAATGETRSGYIARLIREDVERCGVDMTDRRFDPPEEKK